MSKRIGFYIDRAARKYLGLQALEAGDLMRQAAARCLEEMESRKALEEARGPLCGARCRDGHLCLNGVVKKPDGTPSTRCRMHGGKSTGPRSEAGREAIRESNRRRAQTAST